MDLAANSPPVPRFEIDRNTLTRPVAVRGTPTICTFSPVTPEIRTFSPRSHGCTIKTENSAFKPIQSPILNEQSESLDTKCTYSARKGGGACKTHKSRHRARSFITDSRITVSSPQLEQTSHDSLRCHIIETETVQRARSCLFLLSTSFYNQSEGTSSCDDYPDLDVAEIEVN